MFIIKVNFSNNKMLNLIPKLMFYANFFTISIFSIIPTPYSQKMEISNFTFRLDYFYHFVAYFFLAVFLLLWRYTNAPGQKFFITLFVFGIFFSAIFEIIQIFVPNRVFNPIDAIFNLSGFIMGIIGFLIFRSKYATWKRTLK